MHQNFIDELLSFARRNKLRFSHDFNETLGNYRFIFQDQERTWGFAQEISQETFDTFAGDTIYFAYSMIYELKRRVPNLY